jgi:hypothetical protein
MRMTIRVALTAVLGAVLLLGLAAEPAIAAPIATHVVVHTAVVHTAVAAPVTTAPTGPNTININQGQQAADAAVAQRKLIMGGVCVVLLVIVYFGRRAKGKHILRVKNLQNAKT